MKRHEVQLVATKGLFDGLAKQDLLFHQCLCELIDNAIAATAKGVPFFVEIFFRASQTKEEYYDIFVADNGCGMSVQHVKEALQIGESATKVNRLNEHGFGLKNALVTLS